jgi:murein DD-endopeptidase MepM/ murein hydrolase activator NlpD
MAKAQYAIDGKLGKDFKVTSYMGMRIHPVTGEKKHHNGTDIWSPHEPCWIEAPYDAKVIEAKKSTAPGGGFGNYVILLMKIDGKDYTSLFAHMQDGSIKVKKGQKIEAGTPLGKMGTTGMSTGKHLHWELRLGKQHIWDANGKHYIEPIGFFKALIAKEKMIASAAVVATENDPVAPAPTHDDAQATLVQQEYDAAKAAAKAELAAPAPAAVVAPAPAAAPKKPAKPTLKGELKKGSTGDAVKYLQTKLAVQGDQLGVFGNNTHKAVAVLQKKSGLKADGIVGPLTWKALG